MTYVLTRRRGPPVGQKDYEALRKGEGRLTQEAKELRRRGPPDGSALTQNKKERRHAMGVSIHDYKGLQTETQGLALPGATDGSKVGGYMISNKRIRTIATAHEGRR